MKFGLLLGISRTHLLARRKQSIIAALGVTFGIAMFISLVSFMTGLNKFLDGLIINRTPHIRLYNEIKPAVKQPVETSADFFNFMNVVSSVKPRDSRDEIHNSLPIMEALRQDERVLDVAPKVVTQVFYNAGNIEINGIINGVDVVKEDKLFFFSNYVIKGKIHDIAIVNNSIILGKGIADKMLVDIGDVIQVSTAKGDRLSLKVVGLFQSGLAEIDKTQSYASLATTQKLLGKTNSYITDLQVKLMDIEDAPKLAKEFGKVYSVDAIDIKTFNSQFETGTKVRTIISYAVGITLLIVAGFGIYNILNMMIYEKMDDIAILKATGFSGKDVRTIFISQAVLIGLFGGLLGLLLGYLISLTISHTPFNTPALPTVKTYPINIHIKFYAIGIVFAMVTTYFAGLFPARRASKIDPVEIIRGK